MNLKLLFDNILVEELVEESKSTLFIPNSAKESSQTGKVVSIGSEVVNVKVDDTIIFKKYTPDSIKINNNNFLIIKESDILIIL